MLVILVQKTGGWGQNQTFFLGGGSCYPLAGDTTLEGRIASLVPPSLTLGSRAQWFKETADACSCHYMLPMMLQLED